MIAPLLLSFAFLISGVFIGEGMRRKTEVKMCQAKVLTCKQELRSCVESRILTSEAK